MLPIRLQILYNTDSTRTKENCGLPVSMTEYEQREMTFFTIDAVGVYYDDDGKEYGKIFSSGAEFLTMISAHEILRMING